MPKLENFTNRVEIDSYPFIKNELRPIDVDGTDLVSVVYTGNTNASRNIANNLTQISYTEWTDSGDTPYASKDALLSDMKDFFFSVNSGGSPVGNIETLSTAETETYKVLKPDGVGGVNWFDGLDGRIILNQDNVSAILGGTIDSSKEYFIDGVLDLGTTQITIPVEGITIRGYSFNLSGLTSSEDNYNMFISASVGGDGNGSGDLLGFDYYISVTGSNSKVYELYDDDGFHAFELNRVNYIDCTNLGDIYDYRQGLEFGTGRFGGSPSLTLHGLWRGGYRITTSIVRSLSGIMTAPLFKEGLLFQMNSRFLTDINCDLPTLAPLLDFQTINFPNPSTLQLKGCEITRDGSYVSEDTNITPNISSGDLSCYWKENNGIPNTYVGGATQVTSEETTVVAAGSTYYDLEGIFSGTGLQHFSASADGKLTHLGVNPREFEITSSLILDSTQNNELSVRFVKWDDSEGVFINLDYTEQTRQVNSLQGGRDVANFTIIAGAVLDQNDFLKLQVRNNSGNNNVVAETSSFYRIQER